MPRQLIEPGHLTWSQLIEKMTIAPAKVMNIRGKGTLAVGADADITVFDPEAKWTVDPTKCHSKSCNTPFGGWEVAGKVKCTVVAGRVVFDGEKILAAAAG